MSWTGSAVSRIQKSVIVVIHDLTLAARYCDRLVLLHEAHITADGPSEAVLTEDNLARCYGVKAFRGMAEGGAVIVPIRRTGRAEDSDVPSNEG